MAKVEVTHSCGHKSTQTVFGPEKQRASRIAWFEGTVCSNCYRVELLEARENEATIAAETNQASGLVALEGSEKQIAWAESIRKPICEALAAAEKHLTNASPEIHKGTSPLRFFVVPNPYTSREVQGELKDAYILAVDSIVGQASAKWWIEEGRNLSVGDLERSVAYVWKQVQERHLADSAIAESTEVLRKHLEADRDLIASIASGLRDDQFHYDPVTDQVSGEFEGHTFAYPQSANFKPIIVDDRPVEMNAKVLRDRTEKIAAQARKDHAAAESNRLHESLVGKTIERVVKNKTSLEIYLSDGRKLAGKSSRAGWEINSTFNGERHVPFDGNHPEILRLEAEAKAWWFKSHAKA